MSEMSVHTLLSPDDQDALGEIFNIAVGHAAASLSEMAKEEVQLSVPEIALLNIDEIQGATETNNADIMCVNQAFGGQFNGSALLLFFVDKSVNLIRVLLQDDNIEEISELEEEVLCEVGNILINNCIASIANLADIEIDVFLPGFFKGPTQQALRNIAVGTTEEKKVLLAQIDIHMDSCDVSGHLALTLSMNALEDLLKKIHNQMLAV